MCRRIGSVVAPFALGLWLRGLRCVMVLAEVLGIKGASRPFGLEQVRPLTPTTSAREGRSYADPAQKYELHQGIPSARVVRARCSALPLIPAARVAPVPRWPHPDLQKSRKPIQ